jgi:hypothetical protein
MGFRPSDLQEAFFVPGSYSFRVYGYGTTDPLEEVLAPGYFEHARGLLRPGELIYVSTCQAAPRCSMAPIGHTRFALVMVRADERDATRALGSVRLVQDFGRPGDPSCMLSSPAPDSTPAPVKRGRGRPPGSKTKKPAEGF